MCFIRLEQTWTVFSVLRERYREYLIPARFLGSTWISGLEDAEIIQDEADQLLQASLARA